MLGRAASQQAIASFQLAAAAQAAASREAAARKKAAASQNMWAIAQEAEASGDLQVASRLYGRLAARRPVSSINEQAAERLGAIRNEAIAKLDALEEDLTGARKESEKDDSQAQKPPGLPKALKRVQTDERVVLDAFKAMDELIKEYAGVVTVESALTERIDRLRKQDRYAAILQEPDARELCKFGRDYEAKGELCCALLVYEEAAALAPAPSATWAKERFEEMRQDDAIVAAARACKQLQWCHAYFERAEAILPHAKDTAIKYFTQICEIAPADTEVHQAARAHLAKLR
jgi:hypothetical protein